METTEPAILDITNKISKIKILDTEEPSNFVDENISGPDQDQDKTHPAYIPRTGRYFMHDTREVREMRKHSFFPSRADGKWQHDLYNEAEQMPMSDQEFARKYGMDREGNRAPSVNVKTFPFNAHGVKEESAKISAGAVSISRRITMERRNVDRWNLRNEKFARRQNNGSHSSGDTWKGENGIPDRAERPSSERIKESNGGTDEKLELRHVGKRYSTQRPTRSAVKL